MTTQRDGLTPEDRKLIETVLSQSRARQSFECAEDQARAWDSAWNEIRAERPDSDSPSLWNW